MITNDVCRDAMLYFFLNRSLSCYTFARTMREDCGKYERPTEINVNCFFILSYKDLFKIRRDFFFLLTKDNEEVKMEEKRKGEERKREEKYLK